MSVSITVLNNIVGDGHLLDSETVATRATSYWNTASGLKNYAGYRIARVPRKSR